MGLPLLICSHVIENAILEGVTDYETWKIDPWQMIHTTITNCVTKSIGELLTSCGIEILPKKVCKPRSFISS